MMATIYDERLPSTRARFHDLCDRYGHHRTLATYQTICAIYWERLAAETDWPRAAMFREWAEIDRKNAAYDRERCAIFDRDPLT